LADYLFFQIVILAVASIAAQWFAWRLHIPAIIFLLAIGFVLGPMTHAVEPELLLSDLFEPAISAAVAIILFEGSLQLHLKELRETRRAVRHVIFLGAPIGWALISLAAHYIAGLEWPVAVTLGGILIVTGPTVIMPMLRQARLSPGVGGILKWEGIVNDPLGVILAILSYEYFVATTEGQAGMGFFLENGTTLIAVIFVSFLLARLIKFLFERGHMPEYLKAPFLLSAVLTLFFACNMLLHESGLIAVTILGLTLTNIHTASIEDIKRFKETITLLLVSGVFILLTANLDVRVLMDLSWQSMVFVAALLFVIRPLTFLLCSFGTHMSRQEILLAGLIAPRGIVCAAMAGVIGPLLVEAGFEDGNKIVPIAFAVVVISVVLHSLMIKPLAQKLKLTSKEMNGVILAGVMPWSIQLAEILQSRNVPVMLVDDDWNALAKARLADIPVYYGELLSEETEFVLEFNKYNTLIAATPNSAYNALVLEKFGYEYGRERVFHVNNTDDSALAEHRKISTEIQGRPFVGKNVTLFSLSEKYAKGWRFRSTRVGKPEKDGPLLMPEENETCMIIGSISKTGLTTFYSEGSDSRPAPKEEDLVIVFEKQDEE